MNHRWWHVGHMLVFQIYAHCSELCSLDVLQIWWYICPNCTAKRRLTQHNLRDCWLLIAIYLVWSDNWFILCNILKFHPLAGQSLPSVRVAVNNVSHLSSGFGVAIYVSTLKIVVGKQKLFAHYHCSMCIFSSFHLGHCQGMPAVLGD